MKPLNNFAWQLFIIGFLIYPASAEVMDKESTLTSIWSLAICGAAIGFAACRYRPPLGIITFVVPTSYLFGAMTELLDPTVGPAIYLEAGPNYGLQILAGLGLVILCHAIGVVAHYRKKKCV
jgi:hypothetical protein